MPTPKEQEEARKLLKELEDENNQKLIDEKAQQEREKFDREHGGQQ